MTERPSPRADLPTALALMFAAVLPSLVAWSYFFDLHENTGPNLVRQLAYVTGKLVQFGLPLTFVWLWEGGRPLFARPIKAGVVLGLAFGLIVAGGVFALYFGWLRDSPLLAGTPSVVRNLLVNFGVAAGPQYLVVAVLYTAAHSLFEEYYYRWFIFGRMRAFMPLWPAVALSSLVFMAHHILLLAAYLPGQYWIAVVPLSLCVAVGGGVWAWLYAQTRSLYAPWLSHALVDAALFAVGWDLFQRGG